MGLTRVYLSFYLNNDFLVLLIMSRENKWLANLDWNLILFSFLDWNSQLINDRSKIRAQNIFCTQLMTLQSSYELAQNSQCQNENPTKKNPRVISTFCDQIETGDYLFSQEINNIWSLNWSRTRTNTSKLNVNVNFIHSIYIYIFFFIIEIGTPHQFPLLRNYMFKEIGTKPLSRVTL